jgi:hypothetical protein
VLGLPLFFTPLPALQSLMPSSPAVLGSSQCRVASVTASVAALLRATVLQDEVITNIVDGCSRTAALLEADLKASGMKMTPVGPVPLVAPSADQPTVGNAVPGSSAPASGKVKKGVKAAVAAPASGEGPASFPSVSDEDAGPGSFGAFQRRLFDKLTLSEDAKSEAVLSQLGFLLDLYLTGAVGASAGVRLL